MNTVLETTVTKTRKARSTNGEALKTKTTKLTLKTASALDTLAALGSSLDAESRLKVSDLVGEAYDSFVTAFTTVKKERTFEL